MEPFSAQTRQSRTALALTSTALLLHSIGAIVLGNNIQLSGISLQVKADWIYWILWFPTCYFMASFYISSTYEREKYRYVESLGEFKNSLRELSNNCRANLQVAARGVEEARNKLHSFEDQLSSIDTSKIAELNKEGVALASQAGQILHIVEEMRQTIGNKTAAVTELDAASSQISAAATFISNASATAVDLLDRIETGFSSEERLKVNWLEHKLPLLFGLIVLAVAPVLRSLALPQWAN